MISERFKENHVKLLNRKFNNVNIAIHSENKNRIPQCLFFESHAFIYSCNQVNIKGILNSNRNSCYLI